jgi:hypothetical protein
MRLMRRIPILLTLSVFAAMALAAPALAGDTAIVKPPSIFAPKLEKVRAKSGLDVYLPSRLRVYTTASRVRGTVTASDGTYDFQLGIGRCGGANACYLANFYAIKGEEPAFARRVTLSGGRNGYWKPITCGASCSPAAIQWLEGDVLYEIATKGVTLHREKRALVKLANLAIQAGPR